MLKLNTRTHVNLETKGYANPTIEAVGVTPLAVDVGDSYDITHWLQQHTPLEGFKSLHARLPGLVFSHALRKSAFLMGTWESGATFLARTIIVFRVRPDDEIFASDEIEIIEYPSGRQESVPVDAHHVRQNFDQSAPMFGYVEDPYLWLIQPNGQNVSNQLPTFLTSALIPAVGDYTARTFTIHGGSREMLAYERLGNLEMHMPDMFTVVIRKLDAPTATRVINIKGVTPFLWRSPTAPVSAFNPLSPIARVSACMDTSLGASIEKVRLIFLSSNQEWVIYDDFEQSRVNVFYPSVLGVLNQSRTTHTDEGPLVSPRLVSVGLNEEIAMPVPAMFRTLPDINAVEAKSQRVGATLTERSITDRGVDALPPHTVATVTLSDVPDRLFDDPAHRLFFEHDGYRYLIDDMNQTEPLTWEATCTVEKI